MKRLIVLGGLGHFGRAAAEQLQTLGVSCKIASRRGGGDIQLDANDANSIRTALQRGDVVIDTAGPFHTRSMALVESAVDIGFDLIDINDDLSYAERVVALAPRINNSNIRVLSSASSVSAIAAAVVRESQIVEPRRVTSYLAPATRHTANPGAALALIRSVGRPVRLFRDGRLQERPGWSEPVEFHMPPPLQHISARLFESADAIHLPRIWPSLRNVAMYVDTNTFGANTLLTAAARVPLMRNLLERGVRWSTRVARLFGSAAGGIAYEVEGADGNVSRRALVARENSFLTAVAPAILAAQAIAEDRFTRVGLVPPDQHVDPYALLSFLQDRNIDYREGDEAE